MSEVNRDIFPILLTIPGAAEPLKFGDRGALVSWIELERRWEPFISKFPAAGSLSDIVLDRFRSVGVELRQRSAGLNEHQAQSIGQLFETLQYYRTGRAIPFDSEPGEFLRKQIEIDPLGALGVAFFLMGIDRIETFAKQIQTTNDIESARAVLLGMRMVAGFSREKRLQEMLNELSTVSESVTLLTEQTKTVTAEITSRLAQAKLREPIGFWSAKANRHFWASLVLLIIFLVLAVLFGGIDWLSGVPFLKAAYTVPQEAAADIGVARTVINGGFVFWPVFVSAVTVGVELWILRIVIRWFYISQNLYEDALERKVMVQSLLALADQPLMKDQLTTSLLPKALDILFRSAPKTVTGDDGSPPDLTKIAETIGNAFKR
ncbi:MAG: hypothetical protein EPO08_19415 [Rhodospirillaceae bacterium]|nr:MAG: hypothetical protein EPO08_19415 [Rhodospirillaceae bacterium]